MPPTVRSLDELYASRNALYDPQRQAIRQQIDQTQQSGQAEDQALYASKDRAFRDISQLASNKNMLFSGFAPDQQARYVGEKFLPAQANLRSKIQDNIARLQSAMLGLDTDQRKDAMNLQEQDLGRLYAYQQEQDRRKYEKEQSDLAYQRELEKLKTQASLSAKAKAAESAPGKPGTDFLNHISSMFQQNGGQGNKNITRQQQDQWANQWFLDMGIMDPAARQYFWDLFNTTYKRASDPKKDWRYKK